MLKFFKKIRRKLLDEGHLRKYLVYAFGEILLVMIGILLAIQVDNWNNTRIDRHNEVEYLGRLTRDLETDTTGISDIISYAEGKKTSLEAIYPVLSNSDVQIIDTLEFIIDVSRSRSLGWMHYNVTTNTVEELKSTGNFSIIENEALRSKISAYYHSAEDEFLRIDKRRGSYPNEVWRIVPRVEQAERETVVSDKEVIESIRSSDLRRYIIAELNFADFVIERQNVLLNLAIDLLNDIEAELNQ